MNASFQLFNIGKNYSKVKSDICCTSHINRDKLRFVFVDAITVCFWFLQTLFIWQTNLFRQRCWDKIFEFLLETFLAMWRILHRTKKQRLKNRSLHISEVTSLIDLRLVATLCFIMHLLRGISNSITVKAAVCDYFIIWHFWSH